MRRILLAAAVLGAALTVTTTGPSFGAGAAAGRRCPPLQIGLLARLSGTNAATARNELAAAQIAVDRFRAANPDCPVTLVPLDGGADGSTMGDALRAAGADPALVAVVGPQRSDDTLVVGGLLELLRLPFVTMSATRPGLSEQGWTSFHRAVGSDLAQGDAAAAVIGELRPTSVAVVDDGSAYGTALAAQVRDGLGDTAVTVHLQPDGSGVGAAVTALAGLGPSDVVFYAGYDTGGLPLLAALRAAGNRARIVGGDGLATASAVAAGALTEGIVVTCPCSPAERIARATDFVAAFTRATGAPPSSADRSLETYDATDVVLATIARGAHTRASVQRALGRIRFRGLSGTIAFDDRGELTDPTVWSYRIQDGTLVPVERVTNRV